MRSGIAAFFRLFAVPRASCVLSCHLLNRMMASAILLCGSLPALLLMSGGWVPVHCGDLNDWLQISHSTLLHRFSTDVPRMQVPTRSGNRVGR